jgi:hypothetical protein
MSIAGEQDMPARASIPCPLHADGPLLGSTGSVVYQGEYLMRSLTIAGVLMLALTTGCATTHKDAMVLKGGLFGPAMSRAELNRAIAKAAAFPLGDEKNPVRVNMPPGEQAYLARLRCSDGTAPAYRRDGSLGTGVYGNILDLYSVSCATGAPAAAKVHMDMYHPDHSETRAIPGFTIVAQ